MSACIYSLRFHFYHLVPILPSVKTYLLPALTVRFFYAETENAHTNGWIKSILCDRSKCLAWKRTVTTNHSRIIGQKIEMYQIITRKNYITYIDFSFMSGTLLCLNIKHISVNLQYAKEVFRIYQSWEHARNCFLSVKCVQCLCVDVQLCRPIALMKLHSTTGSHPFVFPSAEYHIWLKASKPDLHIGEMGNGLCWVGLNAKSSSTSTHNAITEETWEAENL